MSQAGFSNGAELLEQMYGGRIYCIGYIEVVWYPNNSYYLHAREAENPIGVQSTRLGASEVPVWYEGLGVGFLEKHWCMLEGWGG